MSGRTEPDWNRWEASLGRVQAVREWRSFPCKAALQTSDLNCWGMTGTLETTFLLVGATGFEPATFRPPAECATSVKGSGLPPFSHSHAV